MLFRKTAAMPSPGEALPGRPDAIPTATTHFVNGHPLQGPWPDGVETAIFAMGCFWGVERIFWKLPGVWSTAVGYINGMTPNPTYEEVCTGTTGHAEAIEVVFDPARLSYEALLNYFFRMHDPTTLNRQHNDVGTQYRSAIFFNSDAQKQTAERVKAQWDKSGKLSRPITPEITLATKFYSAEDYHQDYLVKHPDGYTCHVLRAE